jgi:hypothetical protein
MTLVTTEVQSEEVQKIVARLLPTVLKTHDKRYGERMATQLAEVITESGFTDDMLGKMTQPALTEALKSVLSEEYPLLRQTIMEAYFSASTAS